jgi:hypothetical protein
MISPAAGEDVSGAEGAMISPAAGEDVTGAEGAMISPAAGEDMSGAVVAAKRSSAVTAMTLPDSNAIVASFRQRMYFSQRGLTLAAT